MEFLLLFIILFVSVEGSVIEPKSTDGMTSATLARNTYGAEFGRNNLIQADKTILERQNVILKLFLNINQQRKVMTLTEQEKQQNFDMLMGLIVSNNNPDEAKEYLRLLKRNKLLGQNVAFNIYNSIQREEVLLLTGTFIGAEDFNQFYKIARLVKGFAHQELYLYSLTTAVLHREDCKGLSLPPMYEVMPNLFFSYEQIQDAVNNRQQLLETDDDIKSKLSYFTEDVGLNSEYMINQLVHPFWMNVDRKERRGELYLYRLQQIAARYYLERLSNEMGEVPRFLWFEPIEEGYYSELHLQNGRPMRSRPYNFKVHGENNLYDLTNILAYERRIHDAIDSGFVLLENGKTLSLNNPEDIEILGNMIEANEDSPNLRYYLQGVALAHKLLGNGQDSIDKNFGIPGILELFETQLRDPLFYQLAQRILHHMQMFKQTLQPYKTADLVLDGVVIDNVRVDRLETYFETQRINIGKIENYINIPREGLRKEADKFLQNQEEELQNDKEPQLKDVNIIQRRLNHKQFNVMIDLTSKQNVQGMVKIYLGPKYDGHNQQISLNDNRYNFVQLDSFLYDIKAGKNQILRNSRSFWMTNPDRKPIDKMLHMTRENIDGQGDVLFEVGQNVMSIPDRLVLPKGKDHGMVFQLLVSVTPIKSAQPNMQKQYKQYVANTIHSGLNYLDGNSLGYPLDRVIIDEDTFLQNGNIHMMDVLIYHNPSSKVGLQQILNYEPVEQSVDNVDY